ncbi:zf-HC2 domain-containing protein, partial [Streptomyces sp. NPDC003860]
MPRGAGRGGAPGDVRRRSFRVHPALRGMEDVVITPQRHEDVAAYALGVLEPADAHRFEDHLARCGRCRVQLSGFAATAGALREL